MLSFFKTLFGGGPEKPLDTDLVARILHNLKSEPSEQLREILAQSSGGKWSPEALHAARLLLDQRSNKIAPEPIYRTVPRAEKDQSSREREAVASGFSRQLLSLDVGSRVYCRWRDQTGTIIRWQDEEERIYIRYDNGEGEWATLGMFEVVRWSTPDALFDEHPVFVEGEAEPGDQHPHAHQDRAHQPREEARAENVHEHAVANGVRLVARLVLQRVIEDE